MHWYFQLSCLVFIPSPALSSSFSCPVAATPGCTQSTWISLSMSKSLLLLTRVRGAGTSGARLRGCVGALRGRGREKCTGSWGEFPVEILWISSGGSLQIPRCVRLLWPPALVRTSISRAFPARSANPVLILVILQ